MIHLAFPLWLAGSAAGGIDDFGPAAVVGAPAVTSDDSNNGKGRA
jgi:hypothetical protein